LADLSVAIVSLNVRDYLETCIHSVYDNRGNLDLEIFVVDNGSRDDSVSMVEERFPDVKLIRNPENSGFARANNQALLQSRGRYLLLLNPDTEILPGALEKMVGFMKEHAEVGALGARTWSDPEKTFQWGDDKPLTPSMLLFEMTFLGNLFPNNRVFRKNWEMDWDLFLGRGAQEVDTVNGHCLMTRRETLEDVGLLDDRFILHFGDLDWCIRMKRKGWNLYFLADAELVHHIGRTPLEGGESEQIFLAGLSPFLKKHYGFLTSYGASAFLGLSRQARRTMNPARAGLRRLKARVRKPAPCGAEPCISPLHPEISWPAVHPSDRYLLELSLTPSFLYKGATEVQGTRIRLPKQFFQSWPDGIYYWRAAPLLNGRPGPFVTGRFRKVSSEDDLQE